MAARTYRASILRDGHLRFATHSRRSASAFFNAKNGGLRPPMLLRMRSEILDRPLTAYARTSFAGDDEGVVARRCPASAGRVPAAPAVAQAFPALVGHRDGVLELDEA